MTVLSHYQAKPLIEARRAQRVMATTTLDLGLTLVNIPLGDHGVHLPDGQVLPWSEVERIAKSDAACFEIADGHAEKIYYFSTQYQRAYSLRPTQGAPTMLMASFPMHRIKDMDPWRDTELKIAAAAPMLGAVLDTTTGLGYTAIAAAKTADHVTTIELDPIALEVARRNPWSRSLFDNPKITQLVGSAVELVPTLRAEQFQRIIHDPPTFKLAGDLYSGEFYRELLRVLHPKGTLFHYIGDLTSQHGRVVARGVIRRLRDAGFTDVVKHHEAFGVVATRKPRGRG